MPTPLPDYPVSPTFTAQEDEHLTTVLLLVL